MLYHNYLFSRSVVTKYIHINTVMKSSGSFSDKKYPVAEKQQGILLTVIIT